MKNVIVYEDENIIICNKPAGIASQSERGFEQDLLSQVLTYRTGKKEAAYAAIINRLDKPVGGLVLFAKNKRAAAELSALKGEHSIEKEYFALVEGKIMEKGEYTDFLAKDKKNNISKIVNENTRDAKKALLIYEPLSYKIIDGVEYTRLKIRLLTGRHHQIRVQMSGHGHPLYGDVKYNKRFLNIRGVTPALFAYRLSFKNPSGIDKITVEVEPKGEIWDSNNG